jgi:hypothetical protein
VGLTDDRNDPRLGHGVDAAPIPQHEVYLVLSEEERAKGFIRPLRRAYIHVRGDRACHTQTRMGLELCETYARQPTFYGATYCVGCSMHLSVAEFDWIEADGSHSQAVGS